MATEITTLTLGRAIRAIREHAGETPEYMAGVLGIDRWRLAQIEAGEKPPIPELVDLVTSLYGFDPTLLVALARVRVPHPKRATEPQTAHWELVRRTLGLPQD